MSIFERADRMLLPRFERRSIEIGEGRILALVGGAGPPLLMLHGDPQTHLCWHRVAPELARNYTVVLPDIRGRGESWKPGYRDGGSAYTKREMASEQVALMRLLGHEQFAVIGHDRGARVARRIALDHPEVVTGLAVMDIVPALDFYDAMTAALAQDYFYFCFLTQSAPLPERLLAGDRAGFLSNILGGLARGGDPYDPLALAAYHGTNATEDGIRAMCECFRAGFDEDREHDRTDRSKGQRIECPTLVQWGAHGVIARHFDLPTVWRGWCDKVEFAPMPCGHFIPEEAPEEALASLGDFLERLAQ